MLLILAVLQTPLAFAAFEDFSIDDEWMKYFTDIENVTSQFAVDVSFPELIGYSIGMVIYGFFIWNFYRFIARREMIPVCLEKYQSSGRKAVGVIAYVFKYVIVFPLVILVWFVVYSTFLFFMAPDIPVGHVFLIVISLVVTVRISAYYKEDLAKDFAKLIPFALLGIFITSNVFFTPNDVIDRAYGFLPFLGKILGFVIYAIIVETVLRVKSTGIALENLKFAGDYAIVASQSEGLVVHPLRGSTRHQIVLGVNQVCQIEDLSLLVMPKSASLASESADFKALQKILLQIAEKQNAERPMDQVLADIMSLVQHEKGLIISKNLSGQFEILVSRNLDADQAWISESLVQTVLREKKPSFVHNVIGSPL